MAIETGDATGAEQTIPKPKVEWTIEDVAKVLKDKKAMNILFYGLDNVISSKSVKEVWDSSNTVWGN